MLGVSGFAYVILKFDKNELLFLPPVSSIARICVRIRDLVSLLVLDLRVGAEKRFCNIGEGPLAQSLSETLSRVS